MSVATHLRLAAIGAIALGVATAATAPAGASPGGRHDQEVTYTLTYTNLTMGQWLTPPNVAAHTKHVDVFQPGAAAGNGVQQVAENGGVAVLAAELQMAIDDSGQGASTVGGSGPVGPGESVTFELRAPADARRLSLVSMVVCTNDGFGGIDDRRLPGHLGDRRTYHVRAYDAGTEMNTELDADLVPAPFCLGADQGSGESNPELLEGGVIRRHKGITGVGDLDASFDWDGPVASLTVERTG